MGAELSLAPASAVRQPASSGARTGTVNLIQRVGAPAVQTLERLWNRLIRRILRRLTRDGLLIEDPEQPRLDLETSDTLDHLNAASIRNRIAVGQGAGGRTLTLKNPLRDGTKHILFSTEDFIARLAATAARQGRASPNFSRSDCRTLKSPSVKHSPARHIPGLRNSPYRAPESPI
jgi:hypothetical protein